MKTLMLFLLLIFAVPCSAQDNVIYATFSPQDNAVGVRWDANNSYYSLSYGNYKLPYGGYIKDHYRVSVGAVYKKMSLGIAWHQWGEVKETIPLENYNLRPLSMEVGVRVSVYDWFVVAFRYDVLRFEGIVDFGINF